MGIVCLSSSTLKSLANSHSHFPLHPFKIAFLRRVQKSSIHCLSQHLWYTKRKIASSISQRMPILVLDWDETITVKDTTKLIAQLAEDYSTSRIQFSYFTKEYLADYFSFEAEFKNTYGPIDSVDKEQNFQKQLRTIELRSIDRIVSNKFLKGISSQVFRDAAPSIEIKPDCLSFLRSWTDPIYILSINWCRFLIQECLSHHNLSHVSVLANDLEFVDGITSGNFKPGFNLRTGLDKQEMLKVIRQKHSADKICYIGDSHGDLLPIIDADLGLLIQGGSGLKYLSGVIQEPVLRLDSLSLNSPTDLSGIYVGSWLQISDIFKD